MFTVERVERRGRTGVWTIYFRGAMMFKAGTGFEGCIANGQKPETSGARGARPSLRGPRRARDGWASLPERAIGCRTRDPHRRFKVLSWAWRVGKLK